jgi:two-component system alkaline phosphatase synthesis response regulator PhoP
VTEEQILVVDDDPHSREIVRAYLESRGFAVMTAARGEEAVGLLEAIRPALVLLDVMMPGMDGWEVARLIRNHPRCQRTRVIMLTARSDFSDKQEGLRAGADDYLVKPVSLDELAVHVRRNLDAREKND